MAKISRWDFYLITAALFVFVIFLFVVVGRGWPPMAFFLDVLRPPETIFLLPPFSSDNAATAYSSAAPPAGKIHDVIIKADGFSPKSLTIKAGDAVRWLNIDADLHWPASDPHPTHTGQPGFDAGGNLAQREIYVHTFSKTGIFVYHDHNQALVGTTSTITGLIKVGPGE